MTQTLPRPLRKAINRAAHESALQHEERERMRLTEEAVKALADGMPAEALCARMRAREGD